MNKFEPARQFAEYAEINPSEFFVSSEKKNGTTYYRIQHRNTGVRVLFTECTMNRELFDVNCDTYMNNHDEHDLAFQMVDIQTFERLTVLCESIIQEKKINESIDHDSKLINLFNNTKGL